ncbi:DMT family transporter [Roseivirga misakiensis]|uniref:Uncharacterized protein n=1 Tax=Roseivirga misakiensis TaxID=1563681 RepID=A0A1E5T2F8_9BACT|nr:DMT family transporter [Roseivirga misakiensis]OEK05549.1 hypothetical protein BFP71_11150 [Roseivirga misakiensis]
MNTLILMSLAVLTGFMVVLQGGLNSRLGSLLQSPLLAALSTLFFGAVFTFIAVLVTSKGFPTLHLNVVPTYLWFTGAFFSFLAVTLFYYLIPKLGIGTAVAFGLCGQVIFSTLAAHFGWFGLPVEPIDVKKMLGLGALITGILLIKL